MKNLHSSVKQMIGYNPASGFYVIIPDSWGHFIRGKRGLPDTNAMYMLARIIQWYIPSVEENEDGTQGAYRNKFYGERFNWSNKQMAESFGWGIQSVRTAKGILSDLGLIKIDIDGSENNTQYIDIDPNRIKAITYFNVADLESLPLLKTTLTSVTFNR